MRSARATRWTRRGLLALSWGWPINDCALPARFPPVVKHPARHGSRYEYCRGPRPRNYPREINTLTATETVDLGVDARESLTAGQLTKSPAGGGATETWPGGPARRRPSGWLATSRPRRRLDDEPDRITDLFRHRRAGATGAAWSRRHRRGRGDAPRFRRCSATAGGSTVCRVGALDKVKARAPQRGQPRQPLGGSAG